MITIDMIKEGMKQDLVRLIDVPFGVACQIGEEREDNFFYFGGSDADNMTAEEYAASYTENEVAEEILQTLEYFRTDIAFQDEYDEYEVYLDMNLFWEADEGLLRFSVDDLWTFFLLKLKDEKDSYLGSVTIDNNGQAHFGKSSEKISDIEQIIRICEDYDTDLIEDGEESEKFCIKKGLAFILSHGSVFPYLLKKTDHAADDKLTEQIIIFKIENAEENLDPHYAMLLQKDEEDDLIPTNFYKVSYGLKINEDPKKVETELLKLAKRDFKEYFEKDKWYLDEGTFANGAIKFTDGEDKTYIYELVSAEDLRNMGYDEVIQMLKEGQFPLIATYNKEKQ